MEVPFVLSRGYKYDLDMLRYRHLLPPPGPPVPKRMGMFRQKSWVPGGDRSDVLSVKEWLRLYQYSKQLEPLIPVRSHAQRKAPVKL